MFVVVEDEDLNDMFDRLARLMINIEAGVVMYRWGIGESPDLIQDGGAIISVEVPSKYAPSVIAATVEYRPVSGVIYLDVYELDHGLVASFAERVAAAARARRAHDHIGKGHTLCESTPHVSILRQPGVFAPETAVCREGEPAGEGAGAAPARMIYWPAGDEDEPPCARAGDGCPGFAWYIRPISAAVGVIKGHDKFNAVAAGIYVRPRSPHYPPGLERRYHELSVGLFPVPPAPQKIQAALRGLGPDGLGFNTRSGKITLVSKMFLAGVCSAGADEWKAPRRACGGRIPIAVEPKCGACGIPIWGDEFYTAQGEAGSPDQYCLAVCEWCAGFATAQGSDGPPCRPAEPITAHEACQGGKYRDLVPLFGATARLLRRPQRDSRTDALFALEVDFGASKCHLVACAGPARLAQAPAYACVRDAGEALPTLWCDNIAVRAK